MSEAKQENPLLIAVLDASVLFPMSLRDTLLRAGQADIYRMYWTEEILEEMRRNLVAKRSITAEKAQNNVAVIKANLPRALVTDYAHLIPAMTNHPKDRHVLAAAVACGAQIIVTSNLRDFPEAALAPHNIEAQAPDTFLCLLARQQSEQMLVILKEQAGDLRNPPKTLEQLLDTLAQHAPGFVALMRAELSQ
jgi:predicted nucleic acid-binding protein